jgi:hypothetical protein
LLRSSSPKNHHKSRESVPSSSQHYRDELECDPRLADIVCSAGHSHSSQRSGFRLE